MYNHEKNKQKEMPTRTKNRRTAHASRRNTVRRKNKPKPGRKAAGSPAATAPRVIANSVFALTVKPKLWAETHDKVDERKDSHEMDLYRDLVRAYNHGAKLVGAKAIPVKRINIETKDVAVILQMFKDNICPEGFDVNIDSHRMKKTNKIGYHFVIYKECSDFPADYWHFFDIKNLVTDLYRKNRKLHDFFVVFLRTFIGRCGLPTWFDFEMSDSQYILSQYMSELRACIKAGIPVDVYERTGYTPDQMKKRFADIEKTMKDYATGPAAEFQKLLQSTKPRKVASLLQTLKTFPQQSKVVKFMKNACELMKRPVSLPSFCYYDREEESNGELGFNQQVTVLWDWEDHYSATYANNIEAIAHGVGVVCPTIFARIFSTGAYGLKIKDLINNVDFPIRLSKLQEEFQDITKKYTNYNTTRDLI